MGDVRAAGGAGRADGQMHCVAQPNEMRLQGPFFCSELTAPANVAQSAIISVCLALAWDRAINFADGIV
jgi:hypothetical protein